MIGRYAFALARRWRVVVVASALAIGSLLAGLALADRGGDPGMRPGPVHRPHRHHRPVRPAAVTMTVAADGGEAIPRSFLGLSTEYWALPVFEQKMAAFERVLSLLSVPGDGPLVLRVGGDSADHAFWTPRHRRMPDWAFALTPSWLQRTATLVAQSGIRLILDLNLVTDSPAAAGSWARAAVAGLPRHSIAGLEVGNEPDIYSRLFWRAAISLRSAAGEALPPDITPAGYTRDFRTYARVLDRAAPAVPVAGPALANPVSHAGWFPALIRGAGRSLSVVTAHRYPYSACALRDWTTFPTVGRILSQAASAGIANPLARSVKLAHHHRLPFRLTELNSVTCGGRPGVSNTFATALWAPDALFSLLRVRADGVNLHVRADAINAPFAPSRRGLVARPLLYGLILFAQSLGSNPERLVPIRIRGGAAHLEAWAVRARDGSLRVLVLNKGPQQARIDLHLPISGPLTIERLLAPSAGATSGETLGGRWLGPDLIWQGRAIAGTAEPLPDGGFGFVVPAISAALLRG
jgi:hypothetical protein